MDHALPLVLDPTDRARPAEEAALHAAGPAILVDILGVTAWSVSDPAVLKNLLTDPRVSKDASRHWPAFINGEITEKWPLALWVGVNNMFTAYGDDHRRLKRLVSKAFTTRRTNAMVPRIERITARLIDKMVLTPPDEIVDLREALAFPLPIRVIGDLMGLPEDVWPRFRTVVDGVFDTTLSSDQAHANTTALYGILTELVAAKRAAPGEDLTSALIGVRDDEGDGSVLSEQELLDTLLLIISAGYETTANLLDQAVTALLARSDQLAHVRAGRVGPRDRGVPPLRRARQPPAPSLRRRGHSPPQRDRDPPGRGDSRLVRRRQPPPQPARHHRGDVRRHAGGQAASRLRPRRPLLPRCSSGTRRSPDSTPRPLRPLPGHGPRRAARGTRTGGEPPRQRSPHGARATTAQTPIQLSRTPSIK